MRNTFLHKLLLTLIAAFFAASLIQFYKIFVAGADRALNAGYSQRYGISFSPE